MRADEHGWDPKGPPTLMDMRASMDAQGNVTAWEGDFYMPQQTPGGTAPPPPGQIGTAGGTQPLARESVIAASGLRIKIDTPTLQALLAEQGCLLVACDTRNRNGSPARQE